MKDMRLFHPIDRRCPHCNITFVLPGRTNEGDIAEYSQKSFAAELDDLLAEKYPEAVAPSPKRDQKYIESQSASRIQAKARGRASRKQAAAQQKGATRIQAQVRGRAARGRAPKP